MPRVIVEHSQSFIDGEARVAMADEPAKPADGCSVPFMFLLCAPRLAMNMAWAAQWAALGPVLHTLFPGKLWAVNLIQCIGPVVGIIVCPTIGVLSDNCTSRFGRRRPFLFWGTVATVACWAIMMNAETFGESIGDDESSRRTAKAVLFVLTYTWMDISVNVAQVPAILIVADFAGDRQLLASSIAQIYFVCGGLVVSGWNSLYGTMDATNKYHPFFYLLMGVLLVTVLPVCYFAQETVYVPDDMDRSRYDRVRDGFSAVYNSLRYLPRLLGVYFVCILLLQFGYQAYNSNKGDYFGAFVKGGTANATDKCNYRGRKATGNYSECSVEQTLYLDGVSVATGVTDTIQILVGLVWVATLPFLVNLYGVRRVFLASIVPQFSLAVLVFSKNIPVNLVAVTACGITQNTLFALQIPLILHVIGFGEQAGLGLFAGALNSAITIGQLLTTAQSAIAGAVTTQAVAPWPILVGAIATVVAFVIAFLKFTVRMNTM
ncbi:hypothetical protein AeMF1_002217 [Aphanomyces euteiches]|nr:hypothetical protein AeMF1_002217 [Aphanomyces euteiches]KAH9192262.1 hypothetical protein AeNC1_005761 [Aphanomyces euteiches]